MGNFGGLLTSTLRCAWELPLAPTKVVSRFVEHTGSAVIALAILAVLCLLQTLFDPIPIVESFAEILPPINYSFANLSVVFLENSFLSGAGLLFASAFVYLINGAVSITRILYSRLPFEAFGTVWWGILRLVEIQFASVVNEMTMTFLLVVLLSLCLYFIHLSYLIGGSLTSFKALLATGIEVGTLIFLLRYPLMRSGAL